MNQSMVLPLNAVNLPLALVGGKAVNLSRLAQANFAVPEGFILTTHAYQAYVTANDLNDFIVATVRAVLPDDLEVLAVASEAIRTRFAAGGLPRELVEVLDTAYSTLGRKPVAVRSSATVEDLHEMSFAGQHDTYLNIVGEGALFQALVNCWSSLWTARAIGYRMHAGVAPEGIAMAIVVQAMIQSEMSGVLFTANPLNGKRTEIVIEATPGLGEALVSGRMDADRYVVDAATGRIHSKTLGAKAAVIHEQAQGGTVAAAQSAATPQALPDAAVVELGRLGAHVAECFGVPQEVEWAWADGRFFLLQSRPITSLFPMPEGLLAEPLQVFVSFGTNQGMPDPITPLGQDVICRALVNRANLFGQYLTQKREPAAVVSAERVFVNVTALVRNRAVRGFTRGALALRDPCITEPLETLLDDPRLTPPAGWIEFRTVMQRISVFAPMIGRVIVNLLWPEVGRAHIQRRADGGATAFLARSKTVDTLAERLVLLEEMLDTVPRTIPPYFFPGGIAGLIVFLLLNRIAADIPNGAHDMLEIMRGFPPNVSTETGLALWATARAIKADPASASRFEQADAALLAADSMGGRLPETAQAAIATFLQRYGMRGIAEFDLGRPRWREEPALVMQVLQGYLHIEVADQRPEVMVERATASAEAAISRLAEAVRRKRWGWLKARLVKWAMPRIRAAVGFREIPRFFVMRVFGIVREGLLASGRELAATGLLAQPDDLFFLHVSELKRLAAGETEDWRTLIAQRREVYAREQRRRQVPNVLLSDGHAFFESLGVPADMGEGIITGAPASPGLVEGLVRVMLDPHTAQLAPGEILVCWGADPGWTPLFLVAGGLITEVGGVMSHALVVAREYGIPAVVAVRQATTRFRTGQRVRLDGSSGRIMLLSMGPDQPVSECNVEATARQVHTHP